MASGRCDRGARNRFWCVPIRTVREVEPTDVERSVVVEQEGRERPVTRHRHGEMAAGRSGRAWGDRHRGVPAVAISGTGVAPPGSAVAVEKQNEFVITAMLVDNRGALDVSW